MPQKLIAQGAEAKIILKNKNIIKDRIKKSYRIPELDNRIRRQRTKKEIKLLTKASSILNAPKPDTKTQDKFNIKMPYIEGLKLSDNLDSFPLPKQKQILKQIGQDIAKLHNQDIIHGDLTTSNMILKQDKVFFIDFGLGFHSKKIEDKAVDIHLLRQALEAKHFKHWQSLFKAFTQSYKPTNYKLILKQLEKVESRGRYRH